MYSSPRWWAQGEYWAPLTTGKCCNVVKCLGSYGQTGWAVLTSAWLLKYLGYFFRSKSLWALGFDLSHNPPPWRAVTQVLYTPSERQWFSCILFKCVYDSLSWFGKMFGNITHSGKTWHKQAILQEVLLKRHSKKIPSPWYSVSSFDSNCFALCIILHNVTTPPAAVTSEKTKLFIHEPRGTRRILNYTICRGNDLFGWATYYPVSCS